MEITLIIGYLAAILTTSSVLPQAFKTIKTQETKGLSLWYYLLLSAGVSMWTIYGILINDIPLMLTNCISVVFLYIILFIIIKNYFNKK